MLKMASAVIPGFDVHGFWSAIFGSLMISLISWLLNSFINERGTVTFINFKHRSKGTPSTRKDDDIIELENKGNDKWE